MNKSSYKTQGRNQGRVQRTLALEIIFHAPDMANLKRNDNYKKNLFLTQILMLNLHLTMLSKLIS